MSDPTLLSGLCSVCNIKESKYKCPGCSARTCSLPCVKRHKQWAQCTGKRDPTKYMKKSQLVTPAGIDHDYNFLSSIERDLEKSEKSVAEKGLDINGGAKKGDQPQNMDYQFKAAGVKVFRAPKGMSRARENKTHRSRSGNKNLIWTVEWIGEDKTRTLTQSSAVEKVYRLHPLFESPVAKKKRKREAEAASKSDVRLPQDATEHANNQATSTKSELNEQTQELQPTTATPDAPKTEETQAEASQPNTTQPDAPTDERFDFYLLRPRTSSSRRVLIPFSPSLTLGEALRGHAVEEFPTVYYFPSPTPSLPPDFMLDEDYRKEEGEQQREFEELMRDVDPEILKRLRDDGSSSKIEEEVDSKRILDVLKQDLGGL